LSDPLPTRCNQIIGKAKLIELIALKTGEKKQTVGSVLEKFVETVKEEVLESGQDVRIRDFGTFKQKVTAARKGRNPRTGDEIDIPGRTSVTFTAASGLKVKDEE
jgi:DNA-binding protein HU-beta